MNKRLMAMRQRAFESAFLAYREQGYGEDRAIELAEHEADIGLDNYCDTKRDEDKLDASQ